MQGLRKLARPVRAQGVDSACPKRGRHRLPCVQAHNSDEYFGAAVIFTLMQNKHGGEQR
jgi:hypothetical protein